MNAGTALTILIPARNARRTVARAIASAVDQQPARIVLIDHASDDGTPERALEAAAGRMDVVHAAREDTLGAVRARGLEAVETPLGMWLDADDELLPGRAARMVARLESEAADLAFDAADLHDGDTGAFIRRLEIPNCLERAGGLLMLFERNYLPSPGVPAFRTASARSLGYDRALHGAEDFDFVLRAVVEGAKVVLVKECGYRQFASAATLSRNQENQARMVRVALRKHDPAVVAARFAAAGYDARETAWGLASFLVFRGEFAPALSWLDRLDGDGSDRWRLDFLRGTLLTAMGDVHRGASHLERAAAEDGAPEVLNNLGVARCALGDRLEASRLFARAVAQFPGYRDARSNLDADAPACLTLHPLRREYM